MNALLRKVSVKAVVSNLYVIGVLAIIVLVFTLISPKFVGLPNIINILRQSVPAIMIGGAFTLLMISGNIDLSVGGVVGLTTVIYALVGKAGLPLFWAGVVTLALGLAIGALNGFLVMRLRIVPVIATLATMNLCIGIGKLLAPKGIGVIKGLPEGVELFARSRFFLHMPPALYAAIAITILLVIFHKRMVLGKYTAAIGGNKTAAELAGVNVVQTVWILYIMVGFCAAFGGIARASYLSLGDPITGMGMEMDAIIAVLLGGTSFFGGEGSVVRTVIAVLILTCLAAGLQVVGMPPYWQSLVKGVVLIIALVIDILVKEKIVD